LIAARQTNLSLDKHDGLATTTPISSSGAFGNDENWIHDAMRRALRMMSEFDLDVRLVSYGAPSGTIVKIAEHFGPSHIGDIR
jgi:hypothetical protein